MPIRTRTQIRPLGTDSATDFFLTQQERANNELQPFDSPDIGFRMTPRGWTAYLKNPPLPNLGIRWQTPNKELDPTRAVSQNVLVYISPLNPLVTTGLVDLVSGIMVMAQPGTWLAKFPIPPQIVTGAITRYNVPQPAVSAAVTGSPLAGDLDLPTLYWIRWPETYNCF